MKFNPAAADKPVPLNLDEERLDSWKRFVYGLHEDDVKALKQALRLNKEFISVCQAARYWKGKVK